MWRQKDSLMGVYRGCVPLLFFISSSRIILLPLYSLWEIGVGTWKLKNSDCHRLWFKYFKELTSFFNLLKLSHSVFQKLCRAMPLACSIIGQVYDQSRYYLPFDPLIHSVRLSTWSGWSLWIWSSEKDCLFGGSRSWKEDPISVYEWQCVGILCQGSWYLPFSTYIPEGLLLLLYPYNRTRVIVTLVLSNVLHFSFCFSWL